MYLTISSVFTVCFLTSVLALILLIVFKNDMVLQRIGPECMIVLLLALTMRMLFPVEFQFAYNVRVEEFLPDLRMILIYPILSKPFEVTVWHLLCSIWILGIIYNVVHTAISYYRILHYISIMPGQTMDSFCRQHGLEEWKETYEVQVVSSKSFRTPFLVGFKKKYLILPEFPYKNQQLRYIVLHEMMHLQNKDILWKIAIELLCTVFWWNPVFQYLKREFFRLIELRNDMKIVSGLPECERIPYMECLKDIAIQMTGKDSIVGVAFSENDFKELKRRMKLIADQKEFCRWQQIAISAMVCACLALTTIVVFEPFKLMDEEQAGGIPLTAENTYLIENEGQYDVYIDGEYLFTTDDLSPFQGVNIYKSLEEAEENE